MNKVEEGILRILFMAKGTERKTKIMTCWGKLQVISVLLDYKGSGNDKAEPQRQASVPDRTGLAWHSKEFRVCPQVQ